MATTLILAGLTLTSLVLMIWQVGAARSFPVHRRRRAGRALGPVVALKPLHGADAVTEVCLRSWMAQGYPAAVKIVFGVTPEDAPARAVASRLAAETRSPAAKVAVCPYRPGENPKVSTLAQLWSGEGPDWVVISDADVWAPVDLLEQLGTALEDPQVGLVCCLYRLAGTETRAGEWEAVSVNADFWAQALQARAMGSTGFALGAVMAMRREWLARIGGLASLAGHLADDFELGRRVAAAGGRVELSTVVVECRGAARSWGAVWRHQVRWARTIRACRPWAYGASLLANATLWPALWLGWEVLQKWSGSGGTGLLLTAFGAALVMALGRCEAAAWLQRRLSGDAGGGVAWWMPLLKDLLQVGVWVAAFGGSTVEWAGRRFRVDRGGRLAATSAATESGV